MGYYDEAQASLCKFADLSESSLSAHEILILIALSSNYTCTNVQTHQSLRPGVNRTKIAICGSTQDFGTVTKNRLRGRLDFRPNHGCILEGIRFLSIFINIIAYA